MSYKNTKNRLLLASTSQYRLSSVDTNINASQPPVWPTFTEASPNHLYNFSYRAGDNGPIRIMIMVGLLFMAMFVWVYFLPQNQQHSWLFVLLTISVVFKLLKVLHEWYHYWYVTPFVRRPATRDWTVDVLTTFCPGEPHDMVVNTLQAIQKLTYPHTTYLCDEADDPYLKQVCADLGVRHITRTDKADAKAGNINNALRQATGEICLIIDPDHVPVPDFLEQVLPYFQNSSVGFVQCVQGYYNRNESVIAYGATEQTYSFYGPMMICMGNYGTAQAIGANCTFRRSALDSIGGHASGLSEDMHTAMQLHARGWESVYVPLPLSYGLVPATMSAYYKQQLKWARGTFELLVTTYPRLFNRLTGRQRLHYGTLPFYYFTGTIQFIDLIIPILSLLLLRFPLQVDLLLFGAAYIPLLLIGFLIRQYAQRWLIERHEVGFHLIGGILTSGTWWIYVLGLVYTLLRVRVPYIPTPKADRQQNNFLLVLPNLLAGLLTLGAIGFSAYWYGRFAVKNSYSQLMIGFGLLNTFIVSMNVIFGQEKALAWVRVRLNQLSDKYPRLFRKIRISFWGTVYGFYSQLRSSAIPFFSGLLMLTGGVAFIIYLEKTNPYPKHLRYANTQPFYTGLDTGLPTHASDASSTYQVVVPCHLVWPTEARSGIDASALSGLSNQIPLLYIEPTSSKPKSEVAVRVFLRSVLAGERDIALEQLTRAVKTYGRPVLVSFSPEFDDSTKSWGVKGGQTLTLYRQAWRYIVRFCVKQQADDMNWVWCPSRPQSLIDYYPGDDYVDWLGMAVVDNPLLAADRMSHSFTAHFQIPFTIVRMHKDYTIRQKPILITRLAAQPAGQATRHWLLMAVEVIQERYPYIRGIIFADQADLYRYQNRLMNSRTQ